MGRSIGDSRRGDSTVRERCLCFINQIQPTSIMFYLVSLIAHTRGNMGIIRQRNRWQFQRVDPMTTLPTNLKVAHGGLPFQMNIGRDGGRIKTGHQFCLYSGVFLGREVCYVGMLQNGQLVEFILKIGCKRGGISHKRLLVPKRVP